MANILLATSDKSDLLQELFANNMDIGWLSIILRLVVALIIATFIYFIYKLTFSGVTFNRNFGGTIIVTTLVTALIMMILNSNLALSLGMVGALSIIRFRNAVKDPRDISFIFWSVASGLAAGTGLYLIALIATLIIGVCVVIFNLTGFAAKSYLLIVKGDKGFDCNMMTKGLNHYTKKFRLRMKNTSADITEVIYEILPKKGADDVLVEKLAQVEGVLSINMVSSNEEV